MGVLLDVNIGVLSDIYKGVLPDTYIGNFRESVLKHVFWFGFFDQIQSKNSFF